MTCWGSPLPRLTSYNYLKWSHNSGSRPRNTRSLPTTIWDGPIIRDYDPGNPELSQKFISHRCNPVWQEGQVFQGSRETWHILLFRHHGSVLKWFVSSWCINYEYMSLLPKDTYIWMICNISLSFRFQYVMELNYVPSLRSISKSPTVWPLLQEAISKVKEGEGWN